MEGAWADDGWLGMLTGTGGTWAVSFHLLLGTLGRYGGRRKEEEERAGPTRRGDG